MKKFFTMLLLTLMMSMNVFADSFISPKGEYYYGNDEKLSYYVDHAEDELNVIAYGVDTLDLGTAEFVEMSDNNGYLATINFNKKVIGEYTFLAKTKAVDSEEWIDGNSFEGTFSYTTGTFTPIDGNLYQESKYNNKERIYSLNVNFDSDKLPNSFWFSRKYGSNGNWQTAIEKTPMSTETITIQLSEFLEEIDNVYFKYYYDNGQIIAEYTKEVMQDNHILKLNPVSDNLKEGNVVTISWEQEGFDYIYISIYLDNEFKGGGNYKFPESSLNFKLPQKGDYTINAIAGQGTDFELKDNITFSVTNICENLKEENEVLIGELANLSASYIELKSEYSDLSASYTELEINYGILEDERDEWKNLAIKIEEDFETWKLEHPDTIFVYELIMEGEVIDVKERLNDNDMYLIQLNDYIQLNIPIQNGIYRIFNINGAQIGPAIQAEFLERIYTTNLVNGVYFLYITSDILDKTLLFKFTK